jgi:hypothetical protein
LGGVPLRSPCSRNRLLGLFARLLATNIIFATVRDFVRSALDVLEDAARLRLEARWNQQLRGARGVWTLALSLEIDGNPLSLESALRDLTLDPRLRPEDRDEVFTHASIISCSCRKLPASRRQLALRVKSCEGTRLALAHQPSARRPLTCPSLRLASDGDALG